MPATASRRPLTPSPSLAPTGLTEQEAARRRANGLANVSSARSSRNVRDILRANLLTRFNALLGSLLVVILLVGPIQDAFFGLILFVNAAIGIVQELRAKWTLDRLALLATPRATVVRDGRARLVPPSAIVIGDVVSLVEGDAVPVDAIVLATDGVDLDEALLTGESKPVPKQRGDALLAGSAVVSGSVLCEATAVGDAAYAAGLSARARRFQLVRSELMSGINRILKVITWLMVPLGIVIVFTQLRANTTPAEAARTSVAALVTLVPEGLVLLTSLALAVAAIRLGRKKVLIQELPAVEMLARVNAVCIDKTGTLTDGTLRLERLELVAEDDQAGLGFAAMIVADGSRELAQLLPSLPKPPAWRLLDRVPFSSARRFSSATFEGSGTWVLGAPDVLLPPGDVATRAAKLAEAGRRVLLLARERRPGRPTPVALVVLQEGLRQGAAEVLRRLQQEGVRVEVLSGDHTTTVAAVVRDLGLTTGEALCIQGRLSPEQKESHVEKLKAEGLTVAMVGDGVNDILALKAADLAVAIASGSSAARGLAAFVLVDGTFDALPAAIAEGRRVIANVERVACLFLAKTTYAALLGIATAVWLLPFPFLPRHLTLVAAFTIGIPAFFLALAPSAERSRPGFLRRVAAFALPAGIIAAVCTFAAYYLALDEPGVTLTEARTTATVVLSGLGVWILAVLARPLTPARRLLIAVMAAGLVAAGLAPVTAWLFGIDLPDPLLWLAALGLVALGGAALEIGVYRLPRLAATVLRR